MKSLMAICQFVLPSTYSQITQVKISGVSISADMNLAHNNHNKIVEYLTNYKDGTISVFPSTEGGYVNNKFYVAMFPGTYTPKVTVYTADGKIYTKQLNEKEFKSGYVHRFNIDELSEESRGDLMITEFLTKDPTVDDPAKKYNWIELCNRSTTKEITKEELQKYSLAISDDGVNWSEDNRVKLSTVTFSQNLAAGTRLTWQAYNDENITSTSPYDSGSRPCNSLVCLYGGNGFFGTSPWSSNVRSPFISNFSFIQQAEPGQFVLLLDGNDNIVDCVKVPPYKYTIKRQYPQDLTNHGGNRTDIEDRTVDAPNPVFDEYEWFVIDCQSTSASMDYRYQAAHSHSLGQRPSTVTTAH